MDLPGRRISSSSPAPPEFTGRASFVTDAMSHGGASPIPSVPGTPQSLALPMNPPGPTSHSRRSSFGSSPAMRRSVSPAPSLPLPAVMPSADSPSLQAAGLGLRPETLRTEGLRNERIYAGEETFSSFFRRLTFAPDGSLLFTPAGQYRVIHPQGNTRQPEEIINTVYIYTRAGLNKPPVAYLPGHKKPSVAVRCSPVTYTLRQAPAAPPKQITIDTASDGDISALPEPIMATKQTPTNATMEPPPVTSAPSPSPSLAAASPKPSDGEPPISANSAGLPLAFGLPYRVVYAVATSDSVYVYDTQQSKPLVVVSNLHFATFTDLAWSNDGLTLLMTSSDGFCSALSFSPGELGQVYHGPPATKSQPANINTSVSSQQSTPNATPINANAPPMVKKHSEGAGFPASPSTFVSARPASPARSMSVSSVASSFVQPSATGEANVLMHATPSMSSVSSIAATNSGPVPGNLPLWTPPETPGGEPMTIARPSTSGGNHSHSASSSVSGVMVHARRESENEPHPSIEGGSTETRKREAPAEEKQKDSKKRRIAPTQMSS
jgi:chromatin assembly factor 1 subunit B